MNEDKKILIVDDESQITRVLRRSLTAHQYSVRTAADGLSALDTFHDWKPDLIISDLQMPGMDGIELCREIRKISAVPIIVLSVKGEEKTKIEALDAGADDYVTKPFSIEELMARIRASLRRLPTEKNQDEIELKAGDFLIHLQNHQAFVRGEEVKLTPKEFDLLVYFMQNPEKVITHRTLLAAVWGGNYTEQPEYLRVFLGNMRKKIEKNPSEPQYILTEPWVGYKFKPAP
ncbi:MAG: response regulator transcription factor [Pyrinomonadaceae bacterium]